MRYIIILQKLHSITKNLKHLSFLTNQYPDHECDSLMHTIAKNFIFEPSNIY
nr:ankyrin repeat protein [Megavirus caiporensis]